MSEDTLGLSGSSADGQTVGNNVEVKFTSIGDITTQGKVDSGADLSCIHATNVTINKERNSVTFNSPVLSNNMVTMELAGVQDVHSADGGKTTRPTIKLDVEINGTPVQGAMFNLNDRSNMDSPILIGQNVLKAGKFQIDVNKDDTSIDKDEPNNQIDQMRHESVDIELKIVEALQILYNNNITLSEIVEYYSRVTKG